MDLSLHKIETPPCEAEGWPKDVHVKPMTIEEADIVAGLREQHKSLEAMVTMIAMRARNAAGDRIWNKGIVTSWKRDAAMVEPLLQLAELIVDDDNARGGGQGNRGTGGAGA